METEIIRESDAGEGVVVSPEEGNNEPENKDPEVPAEGNNEPEMVEKTHLDEINHRLGSEINARAQAQKEALYYKSLVDQQNNDNHKDEADLGDPLDPGFGSKLLKAVGNIVKESEGRVAEKVIQATFDRETMQLVQNVQKKEKLTDVQLKILGGLIQDGTATDIDHAIGLMRGTPSAPLTTQPNKRLGLPGLNNSAATVPTRTGTTNDRAASSILPSQEEMDKMPKEQLNQIEKDVKAEKIQLNPANTTFV